MDPRAGPGRHRGARTAADADGDSFARSRSKRPGNAAGPGSRAGRRANYSAEVVARDTDIASNAHHFARMGAIIAAMHNQATDWTPPPGFRRHTLDADGLMGPDPRWGRFWDHAVLSTAERGLLLATRDRLHAALRRYGRPARIFSLIHADLHPGNVLIDGTRAAVIDFDDAGYGWHQYDLAVALVAYQDHAGFAAFRDACIAGYRSVRPLSEADVALLPMFLLIRDLAQLGWFHQRPELPRDAMIRCIKARILAKAETFAPPL